MRSFIRKFTKLHKNEEQQRIEELMADLAELVARRDKGEPDLSLESLSQGKFESGTKQKQKR